MGEFSKDSQATTQPEASKKETLGVATSILSQPTWADQTEKEAKEGENPNRRNSTKPVSKSTWAAVVQGNRGSDEGSKLEWVKPTGQGNSVRFTQEECDMGAAGWKSMLVGYIPGMQPKFREMTNYVNNRWKGIQIPRVHMRKFGVFLFDFHNQDKMEEILNSRWFFQGMPLILRPWSPEMDLEDLKIDIVPVWVQFHNLNFSMWNAPGLAKLSSFLGAPIKSDTLTAIKGKLDYARMLVDMKLAESVPTYIPVEGPNGLFKVRVEYEWLPVICGQCRKIGHAKEDCKKEVIGDAFPKLATIIEPVISVADNAIATRVLPIATEPPAASTVKDKAVVVDSITIEEGSSQHSSTSSAEMSKSAKRRARQKSKKNLLSLEKMISEPGAASVAIDVGASVVNRNPFEILNDHDGVDNTFNLGIIPFITNA